MIGVAGEFALLFAFVATLVAGVSFLLATGERAGAEIWGRTGRWAWAAMSAALVVASVLLWVLLFGRRFEYAYVYQQTSHAMPWHFTFSSFWAGQEGSFLLWALMSAGAGGLLILWWQQRKGLGPAALEARATFGAPAMAVVALCHGFMLSMLLGLRLGPLTIGASPFLRLADKFPDAPMLQVPGFVPADGQGLNDLLQNPWMVIHPPTLFVGFTLLMVPFAFAVAGLWLRRYTQWVRPALPWSLVGVGVLGLGIMMGGFWAYETLSFGGWWAWDPVENSSLVPWLLGVAALHAMVVQKKTAAGHKAALWLSVVTFQFVIYSTFLTRSGVLGDVSVHSFVDLGLYNQLLLWIVSVGVLGFGLFALRYRELPAPATPPAVLSRESMIFTGTLLLAMTGLVIILGTSAPILGKLFRNNPSAVPVAFYNTWTLPLAVGSAFLMGIGQLFWWRTMRVEDVNRVLLRPLALTVASTAAVLLLTPFVRETVQAPPAPATAQAAAPATEAAFVPVAGFFATHGTSLLLLLFVFASFLALYSNALVLWRVARGNLKMIGGSLSHVGFAMMLLGIFASAVFNDPISDGTGTNMQGSRDNFVVPKGQTVQVDGYTVTYHGQEPDALGRPVYLMTMTDRRGRTIQTRNLVYKDSRDQWIQHPYVREGFTRDLYVAVFPSAMSQQRPEAAGEPQEVLMQRGEERTLARGGQDAFRVRFADYDLSVDLETVGLDEADVDLAVAARLEVTDLASGETRTLRPVYVITQEREQQFVQTRASDWGLGVAFVGMKVEDNAVRLLFDGAEPPSDEWVVVQAYEKPFMSLLWLGTILLTIGFGISAYRRFSENR
ncbi:MAG: cytochrome c biogenesis protein CcsA [Rubricoccaceae bacterium]